LDDKDWKKLLIKISESGFEGKGKFERFIEKICREHIIFIEGDKGIIEISLK